MPSRRRPHPATVIALVALGVAVGGTVQGSSAAAPKTIKPKPTVVVASVQNVAVPAGETKAIDVKCPAGYTVLAGSYAISNSVQAHASTAIVRSAVNTYTVEVVNPPGNPGAGVPAQDAEVLAGAECAKNSTPIVVNGPFGRP